MQNQLAVVSALAAMFFWGVGDFLIQKTTRKIGNVATLAWIGVVGSIGLLPFAAKDLDLITSWRDIALLSGMGILGFVAALLSFEAFKRGKLSVVDVILIVELPFTVLFGIMFFGEALSALEVALISLIFLSVVLISTSPFEVKLSRTIFEKGALLALAGSVGIAGYNFLTAVGARHITPVIAIWFPSLVITVLCFFYIVVRSEFRQFRQGFTTYRNIILAMAVADNLAWLAYAIALADQELSIVTAVTESYPVIALFLGVWLNREKIVAHQYVGAALALGASVLMSFLI